MGSNPTPSAITPSILGLYCPKPSLIRSCATLTGCLNAPCSSSSAHIKCGNICGNISGWRGTSKALSATRVKALNAPGRYSDGGGLHLYISKAGRKSCVLRITVDGRRRDIGLGGYPSVSLARAREKATDIRAAIAEGRDPVAEKHAPAMPTFREAAYAVHEANKPRWRNPRHIAGWMQSSERHAIPTLGNTPLDRIDQGDVLQVLTPIWTTRPETARQVRQRMRTVFRWAISYGFMESNPAGESIDGALPPMPKVKAHFRALPYQEVGAALKTVEASLASIPAKLCFRFLVLTAARSGEARGATWDEIDPEDQAWLIPSERMNAGVEHQRAGPRAAW